MEPFPGDLTLRFGVEMEMLIRPKAPAESPPESVDSLEIFWSRLLKNGWYGNSFGYMDFDDELDRISYTRRWVLRETLAATLTEAGLRTVGAKSGWNAEYKADRDYSARNLVDETLNEVPEGYYRIEIVSRVLDTNADWGEEIAKVFKILTHYCDIHLTPDCSMHIHVSVPNPTGKPPYYTDKQLGQIARALYLFNSAIVDAMPPGRKDNKYARPNPMTGPTRGFTYLGSDLVDEQCKRIRGAYDKAVVGQGSWSTLFALLDGITNQNVEPFLQPSSSPRHSSWNFDNVNNNKGT
ncbi:hypothetical protein V8F20_005104 [Naviculisporaceae sp. PSN 640]